MLVDCLMDDAVNLLMLVREVIYYIDYPKERPPAALTLKMIREAIIRFADDCPKETVELEC